MLRSDLPFRALVIGAASALAGAALLVLWKALDLAAVFTVLGGLLLAFAVAVTIAALFAARRWRQTVTIDEHGLTVSSGSSRRTLAWSDIRQVKLDGERAVIQTGDGEQTEVRNPHGPSERMFVALLEEMTVRLDASRGYRPIE